MKKMLKRIFIPFLCAPLFVGCSSNGGGSSLPDMNRTYEKIEGSSLYVKKVENLDNDFIMGMDASSVIAEEDSGVKYYDYEGNEADVFEVLSYAGINYIRVRVWNDPYDANGHGYGGGNNDIEKAIAIGKRATANKMKLLVDFHYSDFWADPAKQMVPKAWKDMEIEEKSEALYQYTKDCLQKLRSNNVYVGMVQLGNETNGAMAGEKAWLNISQLMKAGSKAVREVYPEALVAVHFANPEKVSNYESYSSKLDYYSVDYDVFGSSYYPYWHGTLQNLSTVLSNIATTYNKKVMVMETSYCYRPDDTDFYGNTISDGGSVVKDYPFTPQGQANCIRNIIDTVANHTTNGIGVCYWEGTWISVGTQSYEANYTKWERYGSGWAASYAAEYDSKDAGKYYGGCAVDNQAFFNEHGKPLESLKVWNLVRFGNTVDIKADSIQDTTVTCDLAFKPTLPNTVFAVMNDDSKQEISVEWNVTDDELADMQNHGPQTYTVTGQAGGMTAVCYINMIEYNYLQNHSFEDDANKTRVPSHWKLDEKGSCNELWVEEKATDSPAGGGTKHYHFWSGVPNTVDFDLEQEITGLPSGTYKLAFSVMGGDTGESDIHSYVKINDVVVKTTPLEMTSYGVWDKEWIRDIEYTEGDKIVIGIHVECEGKGNGAWGKIDEVLFNSQLDN
jgi:arabinogalactan endo-1,4-beta-galactosidase